MKRRTLTLTLCILAVVALIGVGFASWVITNDVKGEAEGSIEVDTIDDQTHEVKVTSDMNNVKVIFGAKAKTAENATNNWLRYKNTDVNENLTIEIKFTVTNYKSLATENGIVATIAEKEDSTAYATAATAGYVVPFTSNDANHVTVTVSAITANADDETLGEGTITIVFKWGSHFGYVNPIDYYNRFESSAEYTTGVTYLKDATDSLNSTVFKALANAKYVLTITPVTAN